MLYVFNLQWFVQGEARQKCTYKKKIQNNDDDNDDSGGGDSCDHDGHGDKEGDSDYGVQLF